MHYLSICAIVKDEDDYLVEWVRYHRAAGVEKFHIFDNGSASPVMDVLRDYVAAGFVNTYLTRQSPAQIPAYNYFLQRFAGESFWVAFIDVDEFLVPVCHNDLKTLLRDYEPFAGLAVNWLMFGSSGHKTRPAGLTMDHFRLRAEKSHPENAHVKCIVQPQKVAAAATPHTFLCKQGYACVNERKQPVSGPFSPHSSELIQLNHYCMRSEAECAKRRTRLRADGCGMYPPLEWYRERDATCNAVLDETILRFRPFVV